MANQLCISGYLPLMHAWKDEQTENSMLSQWHSPMQSLRLLMELQKESTHRPVKYDLTLPYEFSYSSVIRHSKDSITTIIHHQEHHRHSVGGTQYPGNSQPPLPEVTPPTLCKLSTGSSLRNNRLMKQAFSGACLLRVGVDRTPFSILSGNSFVSYMQSWEYRASPQNFY